MFIIIWTIIWGISPFLKKKSSDILLSEICFKTVLHFGVRKRKKKAKAKKEYCLVSTKMFVFIECKHRVERKALCTLQKPSGTVARAGAILLSFRRLTLFRKSDFWEMYPLPEHRNGKRWTLSVVRKYLVRGLIDQKRCQRLDGTLHQQEPDFSEKKSRVSYNYFK